MTFRQLIHPMDFYRQLGTRLRTLRLRAGLSQGAVGARLGRSAGAINRYERCRRRVPLRDLPRMAAIFGVPPASLLGGDPAKAPRRGHAAEVHEEPAAYGGRRRIGSSARRTQETFAEALSPARLRRLATQAGLGEHPDAESLRRYARLVLQDFARYTRRRG